jgi:ribosome-associated protein YbcJ (S4-like RNA binding protein)
MFRYLMGLVAIASVMASPAMAGGGGGGAKKDATIRFIHDLDGQGGRANVGNVVVIADPPAALIARMTAAGAVVPLRDILKAGGVVVNTGRSAKIPVKSGTVRLLGSVINDRNGDTTLAAQGNVPVTKGQTVDVRASAVVGGGTGAAAQ